MDNQHIKILSDFREKIKKLISLIESEKIKNQELTDNNKELSAKVRLLENKVTDLEEKNENLKLSKIITTGDDSHEAKIKVNRIVREIDKCIALLNK